MTQQDIQKLDPSEVITLTGGELKLIVLKAQRGMIEYYDQIPTNKSMNWKGLLSDNRDAIEYEIKALQDTLGINT